MRAAIYIRMSTDDQADSPMRQRSQIEPYCVRNGYQVVNPNKYDDFGERGWHGDRPGFRKLLEDAAAGEFDVIVVDEMSRPGQTHSIVYDLRLFIRVCPDLNPTISHSSDPRP